MSDQIKPAPSPAASVAQDADPVTNNPHTGKMRDARDIESDPKAILCVKPGAPLLSAAIDKKDKSFYSFWYSHMQADQMTGALSDVSHSTARYIWDAALASNHSLTERTKS